MLAFKILGAANYSAIEGGIWMVAISAQLASDDLVAHRL
jgi:hypothetical protein